MSYVVNANDQNFHEEVLESKVPVLVEFWADWCAPCKMMSPMLDALSEEYEGLCKIVKINVGDNPNVPRNYGVRNLPTLMCFVKGNFDYAKTGAAPMKELKTMINAML